MLKEASDQINQNKYVDKQLKFAIIQSENSIGINHLTNDDSKNMISQKSYVNHHRFIPDESVLSSKDQMKTGRSDTGSQKSFHNDDFIKFP